MSIYLEKSSGRFRVEVEGKLGRYRDRCASRKEAKAREEEFRKMRHLGIAPKVSRPATPSPPTSSRFSEARKQAQGRVWRGMASEPGNLANLKIIEDLMGDVALEAIDDAWVLTLRHKLVEERGIADQTTNRYMAALAKFLKWCGKMKLRKAPVPEFPWVREAAHRIRWITPAEEAQIYALVDDRIAKVIRIAIRYGLRRGELLSLEPKQIEDGWVHIWKTKSNSPRSLPLKAEDEEDLRWLASGNMPSIEDLRKAWASLRRTMKLERDKEFVFHATRHTCATRMVQRNVNLRIIQRWMGHKDIKMTLRYAQVNDAMLTDALNLLAA